ncbi:MAG: diguanylate cyclase [Nitriliruptor sp.]|nr:MAG: diguanylate cyclase [Nitriliruptor sp.]
MATRPRPTHRLAAAWAHHGASVPRRLEQRHRTERVIQQIRYAVVLLCLGLTVTLTGGPDGRLWIVSGLMVVNVLVTEWLLRRPATPRGLTTAGVTSFSLDALATVLILMTVSQDPTDPVVALTTILALQGALRWQVVGGLAGGLLGGGMAGAWLVTAYGAALDRLPPTEHLVSQVVSVLLVSLLVGAVVRQLDRAQQRAQHALELSPELILTVDDHDRIRSANEAAERLLGISPTDLIGRTWASLVVGEDERSIAGSRPITGEPEQHALRHGDGSTVWLELSVRREPTDQLSYVVARDVTARRAAEHERSISEQRYRALFSRNLDAVFGLDIDGCIVDINPAGIELFRRRREELVGSSVLGLIDTSYRDEARVAIGAALSGTAQGLEVLLTHPDGTTSHADFDLLPIVVDGQVVGVYGMARDVTDRKRREAYLEYRASHDLLTGLANRSRLYQEIEERLAAGAAVGVLFLDLDAFKPVNDSFGHAIGDQVLVTVARRLQTTVRDTDLVCRLAGDEFCILLSPCDPTTLQHLGERAAWVVAQPIALEAATVRVEVSIGAAMARSQDTTDTLLARADAAMYTVKEHRKLAHGEPAPPVLFAT